MISQEEKVQLRNLKAFHNHIRDVREGEVAPKSYDPNSVTDSQAVALKAAYAQGWRDCCDHQINSILQDIPVEDSPFLDTSKN